MFVFMSLHLCLTHQTLTFSLLLDVAWILYSDLSPSFYAVSAAHYFYFSIYRNVSGNYIF